MIKDIEFKANELLSSYCEAKNSSIKTPVDPIDVLEFKGFSVDYVNDKYALNISVVPIDGNKTQIRIITQGETMSDGSVVSAGTIQDPQFYGRIFNQIESVIFE